jgi:flagellar FliL protein
MTKKNVPQDTDAAPAKKGRMGKFILAGVGIIALIGAGAGVGLYLAPTAAAGEHDDPNRPKLVLRSDAPEPVSEGEGGESKPAARTGSVSVANDEIQIDPKKYAVGYIALDQTFTTNLADGAAFVQVGLSLATYYDDKVTANVQRQMTPIRSTVLMILSNQDANSLSTPQGKIELQQQLTDSINALLRKKEGFGGIDNVYFTNLVIQ